MIQRIQTLYLGVAAVMLIVAASSLSSADAGSHPVGMAGIMLAGILAVISLASVFLFGNRARQRRVVRWTELGGFLLLLAIVLHIWTDNRLSDMLSGKADGLAIATLASLVGLWLLFLADRAIKKDILLVKSMDRVR